MQFSAHSPGSRAVCLHLLLWAPCYPCSGQSAPCLHYMASGSLASCFPSRKRGDILSISRLIMVKRKDMWPCCQPWSVRRDEKLEALSGLCGIHCLPFLGLALPCPLLLQTAFLGTGYMWQKWPPAHIPFSRSADAKHQPMITLGLT